MAEADTPKPPSSLSIRTMRDDLREAKRTKEADRKPFEAPVRTPAPPSPGSIGTRKPAPPTPPEPQSPNSLQPRLPPPETTTKHPRAKHDKLLVLLVIVFIVSALAAGGVWAWIFFAPTDNIAPRAIEETEEPKTLAEIVPESSLLTAYYQVSDETRRTALGELWQTGSQPTMRETLSGDPRLLLNLPSVQQFAYVLLPGDPRLYLVVEGTEEVDQMLAERSDIQVLRISQWRILHTFSTDLYAENLTQSTRADQGKAVESFGRPLTMYLADELVLELHGYARVVAGESDELTVSIDFERTEDEMVTVQFRSEPGVGAPFVPGQDISSVLPAVPADATFIRTEAALANQVHRVQAPAGVELILSLSEPYAYYERMGNDGLIDAGVVATIPADLLGSITLPDATIEQLLPILYTTAGFGEASAAQLAFTDTAYADVPVRYVNVDTPAQALDYAVLDAILGLATSREGMFALIDVFQGTQANASTTWGSVEEHTRELGPNRTFGVLTQPAIKRLLPGGESRDSISFGLAFDTSVEPPVFEGALILPKTAE